MIDICFKSLDNHFEIETKEQYNLILIEKGSISIEIDGKRFTYSAPSLIAIQENVTVALISSHRLLGKAISFHVSFLNVNITYKLINERAYEDVSENYGFIPLNIFYERSNKYYGCIPLYSESLTQFREQFHKFYQAISEQKDKRWSCRARLHLNIILELAHQLYLDYINEKLTLYDSKDSNVWVSILLEKIHNDYMKPISLATLSEYIHINKTTVGIHFKKITGFSVTDYIINYRIKCACYSLATTGISIKEIAMECGFKQEAYFIRQFTAKKGMSPTEYRNRCVALRKNDF